MRKTGLTSTYIGVVLLEFKLYELLEIGCSCFFAA